MEYNGYHFVGEKLRDGRPVPKDGETLVHSGEIKWCRSGLYASPTAWGALMYAPGNTLCRVNCRDIVKSDIDKFVCRERTIVVRRDVTQILRKFARECAIDVLHLWDAPDIVVEYLKSGDENLRSSARGAARDAARDAAKINQKQRFNKMVDEEFNK